MQKKNSLQKKSVKEMDEEIEELLLSESIESSDGFVFDPSKKRGRPRIGEKFQITAPNDLVDLLKKAGDMRGVGYQTMARIILKEKINDYLQENV
jgi:hypothetical protein